MNITNAEREGLAEFYFAVIRLKADRRMLRRAVAGGLVGTVAGGALALRNGKKRVADEKARKKA